MKSVTFTEEVASADITQSTRRPAISKRDASMMMAYIKELKSKIRSLRRENALLRSTIRAP